MIMMMKKMNEEGTGQWMQLAMKHLETNLKFSKCRRRDDCCHAVEIYSSKDQTIKGNFICTRCLHWHETQTVNSNVGERNSLNFWPLKQTCGFNQPYKRERVHKGLIFLLSFSFFSSNEEILSVSLCFVSLSCFFRFLLWWQFLRPTTKGSVSLKKKKKTRSFNEV